MGSLAQLQDQAKDTNLDVIEMEPVQIEALISKLGPPPMVEPDRWFLIRNELLAAVAIIDKQGCIVASVGPGPRQYIFNLIGLEEVSGQTR